MMWRRHSIRTPLGDFEPRVARIGEPAPAMDESRRRAVSFFFDGEIEQGEPAAVEAALALYEELTGIRARLRNDPQDAVVLGKVRADLARAAESGMLTFDPVERPRARARQGLVAPRPQPSNAQVPAERSPVKFELVLLDEIGEGLRDVKVRFHHDGASQVVATDGSGLASYTGEGSSFASAEVVSVGDLREALKRRWAKPRSVPVTDWVQADDETAVYHLRGDEVPSQLLSSDQPRRLSIQPYVFQTRLVGASFDTSKCFLLPSAINSLRAMRRYYEANAPCEVLVVGHTDTSGEPSYNDPLSLERAESMVAYLADDVDAWLTWYEGSKPAKKRWGAHEDQQMLEAVLADVEDVEGLDPVAEFQQSYNARLGAGEEALAVDGKLGPKTRRALIRRYMQQDGTTFPADAQVTSHGCGENFPLGPDGDGLDPSPPDGAHDQTDRRVELFFFDAKTGIQPPPPGKNSSPGAQEYPEWRRRSHALELHRAGLQVPIVDWDDALGPGLPAALELTLAEGDRTMTIPWGHGVRVGSRRRFVFGELAGENPVTLTARAGERQMVLFEEQLIGDSELPIRWRAWLEDWAEEPPAEPGLVEQGSLPELTREDLSGPRPPDDGFGDTAPPLHLA